MANDWCNRHGSFSGYPNCQQCAEESQRQQLAAHVYTASDQMRDYGQKTVTQAPEPLVKPYIDRIARDTFDAMLGEITELRALCQAQAATIERMGEPVEVGFVSGPYRFTMLKDGMPLIERLP